jgi:hypothetical protein
MDQKEKSREKWEREFIEDQYNIIPADGSRVGHIMAKRSPTTAPIPDLAHLVRLLLGGILLVIGFLLLFSSDIPHKAALGVAVLAASCFLGVTAFRWPHKRG